MAFMYEQDAQSAKQAECFVTIGGKRYSFCFAKDFEASASVETKEVPMLGKMIKGRKATGMEIKFKMTIYKVTEVFDNIIEEYKNTGAISLFDIQVTQEDKTSSIGRSTKIYRDCMIDGDIILSMFDADGEFAEQSIEGYCSDYESAEKYKNPSYMM